MITQNSIAIKQILDLSRAIEGASTPTQVQHNIFQIPFESKNLKSHQKDIAIEILCRRILDEMPNNKSD